LDASNLGTGIGNARFVNPAEATLTPSPGPTQDGRTGPARLPLYGLHDLLPVAERGETR
jgi:hypothetical protein